MMKQEAENAYHREKMRYNARQDKQALSAHIQFQFIFFPKHYHEITIIDQWAVIALVGDGREQATARRFTVIFPFMMRVYYLSLKLNAEQAVNSTEHQTGRERQRLDEGRISANDSTDWSAGE